MLHATATLGDDGRFDEIGRVNSHRPYVASWLMQERTNQTIFEAWPGLHPDPVVQAGDHFLDIRVPLRTIGVSDARQTKITIGDSRCPKSAILSMKRSNMDRVDPAMPDPISEVGNKARE